MSFLANITKDFSSIINDFDYFTGQVLVVTEIDNFNDSYAIYYKYENFNAIDWIPKGHLNIIKELL